MTNRRHRPLQRAFIVTVAAASTAAAVGGCDGADQTITNPPPAACPSEIPSSGDACPAVGLDCEYDKGCGGTWAYCGEQGWELSHTTCNPPVPICPTEMPTVGEICGQQYPCAFQVPSPCGPLDVVLTCVGDGDGGSTWEYRTDGAGRPIPIPHCDLPPDACHSYVDEAQCAADPNCQYLVPGCGDTTEQLVEAGCYPAIDCDADSCGDWGSCVTGIHDPCYGQACDACGAEINVCVADGQM